MIDRIKENSWKPFIGFSVFGSLYLMLVDVLESDTTNTLSGVLGTLH